MGLKATVGAGSTHVGGALKRGDVILMVNGERVRGQEHAAHLLATAGVGTVYLVICDCILHEVLHLDTQVTQR